METWTLVYHLCNSRLASRQRHTASYGNATKAYDAFQRTREELHWKFWHDLRRVSRAYVVRPDGIKIPLVSGAPPHQAMTREQFMQMVTRPGPPPQQRHVSVDREILYRRLMSAWTHAAHISADASKVLLAISNALFWGSAHKLAAACELQLGLPGAAPRQCSPEREPLRRRLRGLAKQARSAFPETALVLTYLDHAVARSTEHDLVTVSNALETFTGKVLGKREDTVPVKETGP